MVNYHRKVNYSRKYRVTHGEKFYNDKKIYFNLDDNMTYIAIMLSDMSFVEFNTYLYGGKK